MGEAFFGVKRRSSGVEVGSHEGPGHCGAAAEGNAGEAASAHVDADKILEEMPVCGECAHAVAFEDWVALHEKDDASHGMGETGDFPVSLVVGM